MTQAQAPAWNALWAQNISSCGDRTRMGKGGNRSLSELINPKASPSLSRRSSNNRSGLGYVTAKGVVATRSVSPQEVSSTWVLIN